MKIGLTYDLRDDYLAEGYSEEETAEFDRAETIDAVDRTLTELGFRTDRIGHLKSLTGSYKNYEWFAAVKNKKVYNWNKRSNEKGANDYFETGTVRPDMVLNDLAAIFYPELFPEYELFFYKKLD